MSREPGGWSPALRLREGRGSTAWLRRIYTVLPDKIYTTFPVDLKTNLGERALGAVQADPNGTLSSIATYVFSQGETYEGEPKVIVSTNMCRAREEPRYVHLGRMIGDHEHIVEELRGYDVIDYDELTIRSLGVRHRERMRQELYTIQELTVDGLRTIYQTLLDGVPDWERGNKMV